MPDETGKLTEADKKEFADWLQAKSKIDKCPSCGDNNWTIGEHVVSAPSFHPDNNLLTGDGYPYIMFICKTCFFAMSFMAVPILTELQRLRAARVKKNEEHLLKQKAHSTTEKIGGGDG